MKLLVLGGTQFVGRTLVDEAVGAGWEVTVLNRSGTAHTPGVVALQGDRTAENGLAALCAGEWDVVVDTWSWAPIAVRSAAEVLADRADRYVYISSRSVYRAPVPAGATEAHRTVECDPDDIAFNNYSRTKAGAEQALRLVFGERALVVRPGLILGPHENIGRLPWWLNAIADGGLVPAPGPESLDLQYIDARDLSRWTLSAAARGLSGDYDAVSASGHATMGTLLAACLESTHSKAQLVWLDPGTLQAHGVTPWIDFPIWIPPGPDHDMMHGSDVSKAYSAGLVCRPVADTVADTWSWLQSLGRVAPQRADRPTVGMSSGRLKTLLTR
ncbi:NAD-dependent epimerase/dehydratase family protein [Rhodococcus sp. G-MC3]|uniref:NAD-dependent epimerase/dehydratase family protein n=1 Tax=Rhodococcus sp. G-MC3 TaxID=3046209 RepID=UPI0024BB5258|nr:NAD-dependent epimerase/dehydratase family protein [Rhodococcus sp. G-MC3]MDJ0392862.1 NAD-dependent epimerase/dehydratase family protein [Rhodococcus sp. G-MC3]